MLLKKILSYCINNFNPNGISKRSGEPYKVFAYITEITMRACWEVINTKNAEQEFINEKLIPLESFNNILNKTHTESKLEEKRKP